MVSFEIYNDLLFYINVKSPNLKYIYLTLQIFYMSLLIFSWILKLIFFKFICLG